MGSVYYSSIRWAYVVWSGINLYVLDVQMKKLTLEQANHINGKIQTVVRTNNYNACNDFHKWVDENTEEEPDNYPDTMSGYRCPKCGDEIKLFDKQDVGYSKYCPNCGKVE